MRVTEGVRRQNVADLLMYVNARLWIGHFDLWPEDGTIVFRHAMIFPGAEASAVAMRGAAQSRAGSLRTLLSGLPVRAVGRQDAPKKPSPPRCWSARAGVSALASFSSAPAGWAAPCSRAGSPAARFRHRGRAQAVAGTARAGANKKAITLVARADRRSGENFRVCLVAIKPQVLKDEAPRWRVSLRAAR